MLITNSSGKPSVWGRFATRFGSAPVIQAAAHRAIPPAAPEETKAASTPIIRASRAPASSCRSFRSTNDREAAAMASTTSEGMTLPPNRVEFPPALMNGRRPSRSE